MSVLLAQLESHLCTGMVVPDEFQLLYKWIEDKGFYFDRPEYRIGRLADEDSPGTLPDFNAPGSGGFSRDVWKAEFFERFCIFGSTGGEGSVAAFWLSDSGEQKIVHFPSGSGSTMASVLVASPLDYLRLLAIGYMEVCWPEWYDEAPDNEDYTDEYGADAVYDEEYKEWLVRTFGVKIPKTAKEVVVSTSDIDDDDSDDEFCRWIHRMWL